MAGRGNDYRVTLPDDEVVYIRAGHITSGPTSERTAYRDLILLEEPRLDGQPKMKIPKGDVFKIIGQYNNYELAEYKEVTGWVADDD